MHLGYNFLAPQNLSLSQFLGASLPIPKESLRSVQSTEPRV